MDRFAVAKHAAALSLALGLAAMPWVQAAAKKVDFAGKRIVVIVCNGPGSGGDAYIRAIQPYLKQYLPGHPTVLVRYIPGGGMIIGSNEFQRDAKPDGLTAIVGSASMLGNYVFKHVIVHYKLKTWQPVILSPQSAVIYASPSLGIKSPQDLPKLKDKQLVFGGESATSGEIRVIVSLKLLGLKVNDVWGMRRGRARLAFERGEVNVNYDSTPGYLVHAAPLVAAGKAVPLFTLGVMNAQGEIVRDPTFKNFPDFVEAYEMMHGKKPSGPGFAAWKAIFQMQVMANKAIFLPAKTPKPIVAAWVTAIRKVFTDAKFRKSADKIVGSYEQSYGAAGLPVIKAATTISPEAWDWIRNYLKTDHNVTIAAAPPKL